MEEKDNVIEEAFYEHLERKYMKIVLGTKFCLHKETSENGLKLVGITAAPNMVIYNNRFRGKEDY